MSNCFSRTNPFPAVIKERYPLTKPGSTKETYHVVLDLTNSRGSCKTAVPQKIDDFDASSQGQQAGPCCADETMPEWAGETAQRELAPKGRFYGAHEFCNCLSNLTFKVGDSLGIYGDNDPGLVARLISAMKTNPDTLIVHPRTQESMSLKTFLTKKANITRLTSSFLKVFKSEELLQLLGNKPALDHYLANHDVLDFLLEFGHLPFALRDLMTAFSPLLPRFYSAASSLVTHPNEAHLTVAVSTYQHHDELRYGVASHFLSHLAEIDKTPIPCYVQTTQHFTLPQDHSIHLIMVGPGTGVAPFRGFLQERIAKNAAGKHWLFFGERHREHDFFYEDYFNNLVKQDKLALDLAFSRDQSDKVYVQHKLYEKGAQIWQWLQEGAHFYVCGEADPMAKDVESTLLRICQDFGKLSPQDALNYVKQLRSQKRYLADIY